MFINVPNPLRQILLPQHRVAGYIGSSSFLMPHFTIKKKMAGLYVGDGGPAMQDFGISTSLRR